MHWLKAWLFYPIPGFITIMISVVFGLLGYVWRDLNAFVTFRWIAI